MKATILTFSLFLSTASAGKCADKEARSFRQDNCNSKCKEPAAECVSNGEGRYHCVCASGYEGAVDDSGDAIHGLGHCNENKNGCTDINECEVIYSVGVADGITAAQDLAHEFGWDLCERGDSLCVNTIGSSYCDSPCDVFNTLTAADFSSDTEYNNLASKCTALEIETPCDLIGTLSSADDLALFGLSHCPDSEICSYGEYFGGVHTCVAPAVDPPRGVIVVNDGDCSAHTCTDPAPYCAAIDGTDTHTCCDIDPLTACGAMEFVPQACTCRAVNIPPPVIIQSPSMPCDSDPCDDPTDWCVNVDDIAPAQHACCPSDKEDPAQCEANGGYYHPHACECLYMAG